MRHLLRCSYSVKDVYARGWHLIEKTYRTEPMMRWQNVVYTPLCGCAPQAHDPNWPLGIMDLLGFYQIRTQAGAEMLCEEGQRIWTLEHLKGER